MTCRDCGQACHCGRLYSSHRCFCGTFVPYDLSQKEEWDEAEAKDEEDRP